MNDLMSYINGGTIKVDRAFHDLDRAHDAGTKAARLGQNYLQGIVLSVPQKAIRNKRSPNAMAGSGVCDLTLTFRPQCPRNTITHLNPAFR